MNNITASTLGAPTAIINPPRMWGVEATLSF
jgi:hypothetical protein